VQAADLPASYYDLIYFDAFAPEKQPELWTEDIFAKLYAAAVPGAVLVSYCAQGQFRRNLRAAGWLTEKLSGPPGKREMTRARKPA
jgi:tRNA U34 5-methylaminomethyl-2-thiouridine-forming methyltransferase MnmC